jgi:hypothetical protein
MELLHKAIVVQVPSAGRSDYIFFDSQRGTITVRLQKKNKLREIPRGSLVHFTAREAYNGYSSEYIEIVDTPREWVINNIWFLHHLLELIDFFLPRNHQAENIFRLVMILYQPLDDVDILFFQKFFLCKFFIMIGIYPEPRQQEDREFLSMLISDANCQVNRQKYVFLEKKMIQWLGECIGLHPHADRLKTKIMEPWLAYEKNNTHW